MIVDCAERLYIGLALFNFLPFSLVYSINFIYLFSY